MNAEKGGAAVLWGVQKVKRKKEDGGAHGPVELGWAQCKPV